VPPNTAHQSALELVSFWFIVTSWLLVGVWAGRRTLVRLGGLDKLYFNIEVNAGASIGKH
jgi:hypothetical protein